MAKHLKLQDAKIEAGSALTRHLRMLDEVRSHSLLNNDAKSDFLYLMAIPIIYAAWEGFFRISCSICLRRKCHTGKKSKSYESEYSTLWLQKEQFVSSFLDSLVNAMQLGRTDRRIGNGRFNAIARFSSNLGEWREKPLDHLINFDELVMTHSNVNRDVARINCAIIGIDISTVDFSRLNELLNRRNDIAHGGFLDYPTEGTITDLLEYTVQLMTSFHASVNRWLAVS